MMRLENPPQSTSQIIARRVPLATVAKTPDPAIRHEIDLVVLQNLVDRLRLLQPTPVHELLRQPPLILRIAIALHLEILSGGLRGKWLFFRRFFDYFFNRRPAWLFPARETTSEIEGSREPGRPRLRVAARLAGGMGDLLIGSAFVRSLFHDYEEPLLDVHILPERIGVAQFLFRNQGMIRAVYPNYLDLDHDDYDIVLDSANFVWFDKVDHAQVAAVAPKVLARIERLHDTIQRIRPYKDHHPFLDGLFPLLEPVLGRHRYDLLGTLAGTSCDRTTLPVINPDPAALDGFEKSLPKGLRYITIHNGFDFTHATKLKGVASTKNWPDELFAEFVALWKARHPDIAVVQIGSKTSRLIPGVDHNLISRNTLPETAWVLKHSLLHIDGDSGMVHLARALHTRSLVLFGPTNANYFGYEENVNLTSEVCNDCWWSMREWMRDCPRGLAEPECLSSIPPARVLQEASMMLPAPRSTPLLVSQHILNPESSDMAFVNDVRMLCTLPRPDALGNSVDDNGLGFFRKHHARDQFILQALEGAPKQVVFVGTGRETLPVTAARLGHQATAINENYSLDGRPDLASKSIRRAKELGCQVEFGGAHNLPVRSDTLDALVCVQFDRLERQEFALQEFLRTLKSGGELILIVRMTADSRRAKFQNLFTPTRFAEFLETSGVDHVSPVDESELAQQIAEADRSPRDPVDEGSLLVAITLRK